MIREVLSQLRDNLDALVRERQLSPGAVALAANELVAALSTLVDVAQRCGGSR
jgi:hypothetical protein